MIRQKLDAKQADEVSDRVYRQLRRALHSGRLTEKEYNYWYKKFLVANAQKNVWALRRICGHFQMLNGHLPSAKGIRYRGSSKEQRSSNRVGHMHVQVDDERNRALHLEQPHRSVVGVSDALKKHQHLDVPSTPSSIEPLPLNDVRGSIIPSGCPYKSSTSRTSSASRYGTDEERGRSRHREVTCNNDQVSTEDLNHVVLGYRSRRRRR